MSRTRRLLLLVLCAAAAPTVVPTGAHAQQTSIVVRRGAPIRIWTSGFALVGIYHGFRADSVHISLTELGPPAVIPRSAVDRMELRVRESQRPRTMKIAGAAGSVLGIATGLAIHSFDDDSTSGGFAISVAMGAAGGLIGLALGAASAEGAQWVEVTLPEPESD
ncbi:MAG: hypothetical protein ABFS34_08180 [Gemmatimonadota bacterium]